MCPSAGQRTVLGHDGLQGGVVLDTGTWRWDQHSDVDSICTIYRVPQFAVYIYCNAVKIEKPYLIISPDLCCGCPRGALCSCGWAWPGPPPRAPPGHQGPRSTLHHLESRYPLHLEQPVPAAPVDGVEAVLRVHGHVPAPAHTCMYRYFTTTGYLYN